MGPQEKDKHQTVTNIILSTRAGEKGNVVKGNKKRSGKG
jgi:hypothetical protein